MELSRIALLGSQTQLMFTSGTYSFTIMRLYNASIASSVDSTDIDFLFQRHMNKPANLNPAICASCPPIDLFPGLPRP